MSLTWQDLSGQNIDDLFDDPFYQGSSAASPFVPNELQVSINGHAYIIEPSKYQRVTVPLRREPVDQSVEPSEQSLNQGGSWRRGQDNWFLGAGQLYLDNMFGFVAVYVHSGEDPSVRTRFWRSKGVNPWAEGQLSLLPEYSLALASASGTPLLSVVGSTMFFWDGSALSYTTNPKNVTPTFTAVAPPAGSGSWPTVTAMTTDGANLYLACGTSGVVMVTAGTPGSSSYLRPVGPTPSVSNVGTAGTTTYTYYVVATDINGYKSLVSASGVTTTGNATLNGTNYNVVSWSPVPGAVSYDVLKTDTAHSVVLTTTSTSYNDQGAASSPYSAPTATTQNFQATFVAYGNSFLIAGAGPTLVQVAANGTTTLVMKHFNPSFVWSAGCGSNVAIYAAGNAGQVSEIYGIQISTTTFGLGAPFIAGQVGIGETVNALTYYQGLVIVASNLGVRAMQDTSANGHLTSGPVITALGGSQCLAAYGAFVWFGVTNYSENDGIWTNNSNAESGLGRLSLSQFSTPLLPAYATDVMATNGVTGTCTAVAIWSDGTPFFAIAGSGLWQPDGNVVAQGYVEPGWSRYGTVESKIVISADVRHSPLPAGASVQVQIVPFGRSPILLGSSAGVGTIGTTTPIGAGNFVGEAFQAIVMLNRATDPTQGPVLRRWTVRSVVTAIRQDEIVVPIIWTDTVKSPVGDGEPIYMDLVAEWDFLKGLESSGLPFFYQEGAKSYTCFIDQIQLDTCTKWNDQKTMLQGILNVKLLTLN